MFSIHRFVASAIMAGAVAAGAQQKPGAPAGAEHAVTISLPRPLLPDSFAGWVSQGSKPLADAAQADSANAAALKEYDFQNGATATYRRDGETLTLKALRFKDVSGAYGAYSLYRQNGWP